MVRAAREAGDFRVLYPRGAERVTDIAWFIQVAIEFALSVLNWYENLPKEDIPPEYLWGDDKGLEQWFASVREKQDEGRPASRGATDHAQTDQAPAMVQNDQARALREVYS